MLDRVGNPKDRFSHDVAHFIGLIMQQLYIHLFVPVKELVSLHDRHLTRPTLDDNVDEEHAIEIQTQEITQV